MYNIQELIGKVVTIKTLTGEILALLLSTDEDTTVITLKKPMNVVVNAGEVVLVPLVLTADANMVSLPTSNILFVTEALESASADYLSITEDAPVEVAVEEVADEETGIVSE
jgi:hypothetical protein|tara:strand:- start:4582 stop:4917 length:336 start_codon:yes stop_codon:yes gene_type:complete